MYLKEVVFIFAYINNSKVNSNKMFWGSSYIPYTIFPWVIRIWEIGRSQFHIDKINPILTWIMVDIFYSTCPSWTTFTKMIKKIDMSVKINLFILQNILQLLFHGQCVEWTTKSIIRWSQLEEVRTVMLNTIPIALKKHSDSIISYTTTGLHYL